ncbi:MAG: lasso peptide biosynthesis protein [Deltaproteobacteria bacterium]|nr:lasso peptide biosynthesis protein [Deltaproteobacteria bacterium]
MSRKPNRKFFFNLIGVVVVAVWLTMMGFLIKRVQLGVRQPDLVHKDSIIDIAEAQREWKEIFIRDKKAGYAVSTLKPFEDGYFIQEEVFLRLNLMGMGRDLYMVTQTNIDDRFLLRNFYFKMTSGVVQFYFTGHVEGDQLIVKTGMGKDQRTQTIQLSRTPMMNAGVGYFFQSKKIQVGDTFTMPLFDPATMAQKEAVIRVTAKESLDIRGIVYQAFRLEAEMWGRPMTFWVDEHGSTLKEEGFMGLTTIKSSAANAPLDMESGTDEDFYEITSVPIDQALPDPMRLNYLKLRIHGIDPSALPSGLAEGDDDRQAFYRDIVVIQKEELPLKAPYALPKKDWPISFRPFVEPEFNIESDATEIIQQAREIAGDDANPLSVARKLMLWVYRNLDKRPVVSIPSALEVLKTRMGDCNEHATLITAMLRAVGIPARLNVGIVYNRNAFYYHAWTEAYLGNWITMDATMNQMPADVSHIRLVRGNIDQQVEIMGLIGNIHLELLDTRHD